MRICPDRNGIAVSVIQDGIILSDGTQHFCAVSIFNDWYWKQMLSLLGKHLCGYPSGRTMNFDVSCSFQPRDSKRVQRTVVVRINAVLNKAVLDVSDDILDLALRLRIGAAAHINGDFAFLPELLKFVGVGDFPGVFADTDDAVLVKDHFPRHTAEVAETVMADLYQVNRSEWPALALRVFVPRV